MRDPDPLLIYFADLFDFSGLCVLICKAQTRPPATPASHGCRAPRKPCWDLVQTAVRSSGRGQQGRSMRLESGGLSRAARGQLTLFSGPKPH